MSSLIHKEKLAETYSIVREVSFDEKKSDLFSQKNVDSFLDNILKLKNLLSEKSKKLDKIVVELEKITWFDNPDDDSLKLINDLIASCKDLHSALKRQFILMLPIKKKKIATQELKVFKSNIDDIKESYEDLESTFFFLPQMPDFIETTKQLSLH